ncbi:MAG: hypothetical protein WCZ72_02420 [Gemmobacter sp.]
MDDLTEYERRIGAALERIGLAVEGLATVPERTLPPVDADGAAALRAEVARLTEALETERGANAQLTERVRAIRERQDATVTQMERRIEKLTAQLDAQGLESQRLRKSAVSLREALRALREAAAAGLADGGAVNRAMQAELESLRATRMAEIAEMEEILSELEPLLPPVPEAEAAEEARDAGA